MKKFFRILHIAVIVLTICFVFSNSLMPDAKSSAQSDFVGDVLTDVITDGGSKPLEGRAWKFIIYIRKVAHFVEYFFLSSVITLFAVLFCRSNWRRLLVILITVPVAFIDEGLQFLTTRSPSLKDVLLNCWGGLWGFLIVAVIALSIRLISFAIAKGKTRMPNKHHL